jgi:tripartite-type tricarboxylate transporter receptor subunit TctC
MLVPYPAGGPNDVLGRIIAQKLSAALGQQVVVDNRGGASGTIAADIAARAVPDGHTLFFAGAATLATTPALKSKLPYDPLKDFAPVSLVGSAPLMLVVHPSVPAGNARDLVALARSKPGYLNYASGGVGGLSHVAAELLRSMTGIDIVHVPFSGGAPSTIATVSGQVHLFFAGLASALPMAKQGKLKVLGVTSAKRTAIAPDVATLSESGVPGYELVTWFALVAPAGAPTNVIARLNAEVGSALAAQETKKAFVDLGVDPQVSTPDELGRYTRSELVKWRELVKRAGIQPE